MNTNTSGTSRVFPGVESAARVMPVDGYPAVRNDGGDEAILLLVTAPE